MRKFSVCVLAASAILAVSGISPAYAASASYNIPGRGMIIVGGNGFCGNDLPGGNVFGRGCTDSGRRWCGQQVCNPPVVNWPGICLPDNSQCGNPCSQDLPSDILRPNLPDNFIPDDSDTEEPQKPDVQDPQKPDTQDPQNPDVQKPGNPDTQKPQNPDNQKPDNPDIQEPQKPDDGTVMDESAKEVVTLVNAERAKAGLPALTVHNGAAKAAQMRARELVVSFSHTRPDGSGGVTALNQAGVSYRGYGENIAYGQTSAGEVMRQWMNSSGHRANILNGSFTSIGVGHYKGENGVDYWTQMFIY